MKTYILLLLCMTGSIQLNANNRFLNWGHAHGSSANQQAVDLVIVPWTNDVLVFGTFYDSLDLDPDSGVSMVYSAGNQDIYIQKFNDQGDFIWGKSIGGPGWDEVRDAEIHWANRIYICGFMEDSIDLDPGAGVDLKYSEGKSDLFVARLDTAGDLVWGHTIGNQDYDYANGLGLTDDGNYVYVTGGFIDTVDFDPGNGVDTLTSDGTKHDAFLWKLDKHGSHEWVRFFGDKGGNSDGADYGNDVFAIGDKVFLSGAFSLSADFDPGHGQNIHQSAGGSDAFVVNLDKFGAYHWVNVYGGAGGDQAMGVAVGGGSYWIGGMFGDTVDFDLGSGTHYLNGQGGTDIFVARVNEFGDYQDAFSIGGKGVDAISEIVNDSGEVVHMVGYYSDSVDFDPGTDSILHVSEGGFDAFWYSIHPTSNTPYFHHVMGDAGADALLGLAVSMEYDLVGSAGYHSGSMDYDPGPGIELSNVSSAPDALHFIWDECRVEYTVIPDTACAMTVTHLGDTIDSSVQILDTLMSVNECDSVIIYAYVIDQMPDTGLVYDSVPFHHYIANMDSGPGVSYKWFYCSNKDSVVGTARNLFWNNNWVSCGPISRVVIENGTCVDTSRCASVCVGVNENSRGVIEIFPNPSLGFIQLSSPNRIDQIEIWDLQGRSVISEFTPESKLEFSLDPGLYLFRVETDAGVAVEKVLVK